MHLFEFAFFGTGFVYALFYDPRLIFIFSLFVIGYLVIASLFPSDRTSTRRKIMFATWSEPSEGIITVKLEVPAERTIATLEKYPKENRPTLTHFVIRAVADMIKACPSINGKIVWGKFIPYKTVDVTCLVDVDGGKDLAAVLLSEVDKMSLDQVRSVLHEKASKIKKSSGDAEHKKRTSSAKLLPAFVVQILVKLTTFVTCHLGINLPFVGMKKDNFGVAMVTSVGMLGFKDCIAPLTPFANNAFIVTVNQVHDRPIIVNKEVKVGPVLNINISIDHRYIDGGAAKNILNKIMDAFEKPEEFIEYCAKKQV